MEKGSNWHNFNGCPISACFRLFCPEVSGKGVCCFQPPWLSSKAGPLGLPGHLAFCVGWLFCATLLEFAEHLVLHKLWSLFTRLLARLGCWGFQEWLCLFSLTSLHLRHLTALSNSLKVCTWFSRAFPIPLRHLCTLYLGLRLLNNLCNHLMVEGGYNYNCWANSCSLNN